MLKILCCGSRNWKNKELIYEVLSEFPPETIVLHGSLEGADQMTGEAASKLGLTTQRFTDVDEQDFSDTPSRALQMLVHKPKLVIAFHENIEKSVGTKHILSESRKCGIPIKLVTL